MSCYNVTAGPSTSSVYRLYRELSLQLRHKAPKRRVKAKLREDRTDGCQINEIWAMDFVHDQLAIGRKFRVLRSSIPSVASRQPSTRASAIEARMSC